MTLLHQIGLTVGDFLATNRGAANGFAPTDVNNKLPNSFLNADVVIKDGTGRILLTDLPLSVTTGGMVYQGEFDASAGVAPATPSSENKGWMWRASVAGVIAGLDLDVNDYLVSNGADWEQIDNVEVSVSGTDNEIVVTGNRAAGFVISIAPAFKTRLADIEAYIANIGTVSEFSAALNAAFAAGV